MANPSKSSSVSVSDIAAKVLADSNKSTTATVTETVAQATEVVPEPTPVEETKKVVLSSPVTEVIVPETIDSKPSDVVYLEALLDRYCSINTGILKNDTQRAQAIAAMVKIVQYVLRTPTRPVLERLFKFFKDNRSTILVCELVMQGITTLPIATRAKIEVMYTLFYDATGAKPSVLNYAYAKQILDNEEVVRFISSKVKDR